MPRQCKIASLLAPSKPRSRGQTVAGTISDCAVRPGSLEVMCFDDGRHDTKPPGRPRGSSRDRIVLLAVVWCHLLTDGGGAGASSRSPLCSRTVTDHRPHCANFQLPISLVCPPRCLPRLRSITSFFFYFASFHLLPMGLFRCSLTVCMPGAADIVLHSPFSCPACQTNRGRVGLISLW